MRVLCFALLFSLSSSVLAAAAHAPIQVPGVPQYDSEEKAKTHCPLDTIVWINPRTRLWYRHSSKHYANDGFGGFTCLEDVKKAGVKEGKE